MINSQLFFKYVFILIFILFDRDFFLNRLMCSNLHFFNCGSITGNILLILKHAYIVSLIFYKPRRYKDKDDIVFVILKTGSNILLVLEARLDILLVLKAGSVILQIVKHWDAILLVSQTIDRDDFSVQFLYH